jgi:D-alanyl-D-alanine carboxypeptidase (penicillin-binding protein 5/6)
MGGSQVWLEVGEEFTLRELMEAVAINSANDATVAIAEAISGSEQEFVNLMNNRAAELGLLNTHFLDTTGLTDEGHYSTAYDIAALSRELITKHPGITEFCSVWAATFRGGSDGTIEMYNTNRLIRTYQGATGLKTGFTSKAGFNLSASATRNELTFIAVVLGESDSQTRFDEAARLLDSGFANYEMASASGAGAEMARVPVKYALTSEIGAVTDSRIRILLNKGEKKVLKYDVEIAPEISAPIKQGDVVGHVTYSVGDREVGSYDLISDTDVARVNTISMFRRLIASWAHINFDS